MNQNQIADSNSGLKSSSRKKPKGSVWVSLLLITGCYLNIVMAILYPRLIPSVNISNAFSPDLMQRTKALTLLLPLSVQIWSDAKDF